MKQDRIHKAQLRRKYRVRGKLYGTSERPRLSVFRSSRHIYAQIIDDTAGVTLASASSQSKVIAAEITKTGNSQAAEIVGTAIAKEAMKVGINRVCFDRNRYRYHGRVKAMAEAARKAGLVF